MFTLAPSQPIANSLFLTSSLLMPCFTSASKIESLVADAFPCLNYSIVSVSIDRLPSGRTILSDMASCGRCELSVDASALTEKNLVQRRGLNLLAAIFSVARKCDATNFVRSSACVLKFSVLTTLELQVLTSSRVVLCCVSETAPSTPN